jgi:colanic acid/amylovoran biosynthesis protein
MRSPNGMNAYFDAVAALVSDIVTRHGAEVTFISTCQGAGDYWTDDSVTAAAVVDGLDARLRKAVRIDRDFHTPWQLMSVLGRFDAVVATRLHVAILALLMGVPVLPIAYEFKTSELFGKLGLGGLVQDIEAVTPDGLCAAFEHFLAVRSNLSAIIPGLVAKERRSALAAGEHVKEALAVAS